MEIKRKYIFFLLAFAGIFGLVSCSEDKTADLGPLPVADFTSSDTDMEVEVGETVTFTDASANEPNLFKWTIQGGNPTYDYHKSVNVEFIAEGNNAITLKARNLAGASEITKYIKVTPLKIPDLNDVTPKVKMRFENNLDNEGTASATPTGGSGLYEPRSKYGGFALRFTGSGDLTLTGYTGINGAGSRTVACFIKSNWTSTSGLVHWGASGTKSRSSFKYQNTGQVRYEYQGGGITGTTLVNDNQWHHVAYTYDGTTIRIYVDGVQDVTLDAVIDTGVAGQTDVNIGSQLGGALFQGFIDDVRIYDVALTPEQIQFLSNIK